MITINDVPTYADEFAWDGCHKIYLINSKEDKDQFTEYGYNFFPINELPEIWEICCDLKFISSADLEYSPVSQFQQAVIKEI